MIIFLKIDNVVLIFIKTLIYVEYSSVKEPVHLMDYLSL